MSEAPEHTVPKIVIVDDDQEILTLVSLLLRRIGAEVFPFYDGQTALEHMADQAPDLIMLDLMLPYVDGLQVLQHLRAQEQFDRVPILILSAKADSATIREGLDLGADGYITKPYIANTLIDKVRLMLSLDRGTRPRSEPPSSDDSL